MIMRKGCLLLLCWYAQSLVFKGKLQMTAFRMSWVSLIHFYKTKRIFGYFQLT